MTDRGETAERAGTAPTGSWRTRGTAIAVTALAVAATAAIFARTRACGLPGFDTYPILVTSRVGSWGDLARIWTRPLMDGRYGDAFYRPLMSLSMALDYATSGLHAAGYQLTSAVLFGACGAAVFGFVRRALEARPRTGSADARRAFAGPLVGMLVFLLHPAQFEVVPVPSRRPELLCALFMLLSMTLQLAPRSLARTRGSWTAAALAVLAMLSKETGMLMPVFVLVLVALYSPRATGAGRWAHAAGAAAPHGIALAAVVAVRRAVLGGLGGHGVVALDPRYLPGAVADVVSLIVAPQPVMRRTMGVGALALGLAIAAAMTAVRFRVARGKSAAPRARSWLRAATFAAAWIVILSATYMVAGRLEPWYLLLPIVGWSLLVAVAADVALAALRVARPGMRAAGALTAALLLGLLVWQARYSPFVHDYDEYRRAAAASRLFLAELGRSIAAAPSGTVIVAPPVPTWVRASADRPTLFGAAILSDYSVQAWADLVYPGRGVRVVRPAGFRPPGPDERVVVLRRLLPGFESPLGPRQSVPRGVGQSLAR